MTANHYLIETKDLTKKFGDFTAVDNLSINVPKGIVFGFLGPNGAGKTTSLRMMTGLLRPSSGKVTVDGEIPTAHSTEFRTKIGLIPQDLVIWEELTVEENLHYIASLYKIPKDIAEERIDRLIAEISLEDKRKVLAKNLSGGLKRRLNIILALVHEPEIVVCDEPTPGLDPQSRTMVWQFIMDLSKKKGKTVILTTHFMEEADRLSDVVAIIDHGKLLVVDEPDTLKNSIGEGDTVEIRLNDLEFLDEAQEILHALKYVEDAEIYGDMLQLRCLNAPRHMAEIFNSIEKLEGLEVIDMKIRKTSLEDVFIHLTGRELRE